MKNLKKRKAALVKKLEELKTGKKSEEEFQFTCNGGSNITIDVKGLTKEKNGITAGEFIEHNGLLSLCIGQGEGKECNVLNSTPIKKKSKKKCIWFLHELPGEYDDNTGVCFEEVTTLKEIEDLGATLVP